FGGALFDYADQEATLHGTVERRYERMGVGPESLSDSALGEPVPLFFSPGQARSIDSASLAFSIPLGHQLIAEAAGRWDRYRNRTGPTRVDIADADHIAWSRSHFTSRNFTVGAQWSPSTRVSFRFTMGTEFLTPSLIQLTEMDPQISPAGVYFDE